MAIATAEGEAREVAIPAPRVVVCQEQGPVDIPLEEVLDPTGRLHLNPEIEQGDFFAVHLKKGSLTLQARGYVGFIPLNERLVVYVRPRVPISNLTRIVNISGEPATVLSSIRGYATGAPWTDSLLDIYAAALLRRLEMISQSGMWREYGRREEQSSFPHGRVLTHRTFQDLAPRGIRHMAHVAWFERTADIPANRCLKYAVWLLAQRYMNLNPAERASRRFWHRLNAMYPMFDAVNLDESRRFLDDPQVLGQQALPTLRSYYRDALNLALAIIEERAVLIESEGESLQLPSLVVNMNYVFEAYIRNTLAMYANTDRWGVSVYDGKLDGRKSLFDDADDPDATPDVVFELPDESTPLVIEVKNVPGSGAPKRDAINQAVTYALRYRTPNVVLVTPCTEGQTSALNRLGDIDQVSVYHYRFNLGSQDLDGEESAFAEAIVPLM
jgi:5-methylcytosine-specific restriction enzyme subunit McrC